MYGVIDVESTIFQKGNPYSERNKLCLIGLKCPELMLQELIEYDNRPYGESLRRFQEAINECDTIVGVNIKFDIAWLRRYGIQPRPDAQWIDLQQFFYIRSRQEHKYPALSEMLGTYNLPEKEDIATRYWDQGIDTPNIPLDELLSYHAGDLVGTELVYLKELDWLNSLTKRERNLVLISCDDLKSTFECEWNGLLWNDEIAKQRILENEKKIHELDGVLLDFVDGFDINWSSPSQLSAVLYGGSIPYTDIENYLFTYKDGRQKWKSRQVRREKILLGMIDPEKHGIKKTEGGDWSTDEKVLKTIRAGKRASRLIETILFRRELEKANSTYYGGFSQQIRKMDWKWPFIHSRFNHCTTDTSRLSSAGPNIQNIPDDVRECIVSRF